LIDTGVAWGIYDITKPEQLEITSEGKYNECGGKKVKYSQEELAQNMAG